MSRYRKCSIHRLKTGRACVDVSNVDNELRNNVLANVEQCIMVTKTLVSNAKQNGHTWE